MQEYDGKLLKSKGSTFIYTDETSDSISDIYV